MVFSQSLEFRLNLSLLDKTISVEKREYIAGTIRAQFSAYGPQSAHKSASCITKRTIFYWLLSSAIGYGQNRKYIKRDAVCASDIPGSSCKGVCDSCGVGGIVASICRANPLPARPRPRALAPKRFAVRGVLRAQKRRASPMSSGPTANDSVRRFPPND